MADLLRKFVKLWIDLFAKHELLDHASAMAFAVLKALVPLTLLGFGLLGALGQERVWRNTLAPGIKPHVQAATFHAIDVSVEKIFSTGAISLIAFASVLAAWYISGSVRAVMTGMNRIYECDETRSCTACCRWWSTSAAGSWRSRSCFWRWSCSCASRPSSHDRRRG